MYNDTTTITVLNFITESAKWVAQLLNAKEVLYEVARGTVVIQTSHFPKWPGLNPLGCFSCYFYWEAESDLEWKEKMGKKLVETLEKIYLLVIVVCLVLKGPLLLQARQ